MGEARTRRLASLAIVAVLHVAIVGALLTLSHQKIAMPLAMPREAILWFLPPPKKPTAPKPVRPNPAAPAMAPQNPLPDYRGITIPNAAPTLGGLHGSLFGCADLNRLTPEERAHCGSALMKPDDSVDFRHGTGRSQQAALWERGRLRKNAPPLLPCMNPNGFSPLGTAFCLAKSAAEGSFKADEQPSYADPRTVTHLPNNGDPPDHPTGF